MNRNSIRPCYDIAKGQDSLWWWLLLFAIGSSVHVSVGNSDIRSSLCDVRKRSINVFDRFVSIFGLIIDGDWRNKLYSQNRHLLICQSFDDIAQHNFAEVQVIAA
jgi:hypothetical protein